MAQSLSEMLPTLGSEKGRKAMNAERRPRKVPSYRGEGLQLQLSGSALVLVAVAGVLGALVIFGFESPLFYVVFAVAVGFGVLALLRIYRGVVFTELESRLGLSEGKK